MIYPKKLEDIIEYYKKLPGIGEKSAERLALATLDLDMDLITNFSESLISAKNILKPCKVCGHLTDKEVCDICSDGDRDKNIICVIEDFKSVFAFEKEYEVTSDEGRCGNCDSENGCGRIQECDFIWGLLSFKRQCSGIKKYNRIEV